MSLSDAKIFIYNNAQKNYIFDITYLNWNVMKDLSMMNFGKWNVVVGSDLYEAGFFTSCLYIWVI